jgi:hypothetical protein
MRSGGTLNLHHKAVGHTSRMILSLLPDVCVLALALRLCQQPHQRASKLIIDEKLHGMLISAADRSGGRDRNGAFCQSKAYPSGSETPLRDSY